MLQLIGKLKVTFAPPYTTQAQTITSLENRIGQLEALAERLIETTKQNTEEIRSVKKAVKGLKGRIANLETTQNVKVLTF